MLQRSKPSIQDSAPPGENVTHFGARSISSLKNEVREVTNKIAEDLDDETKVQILEEGVTVFRLNNKVIATVTGVKEIFYRKVAKWFIVALIAVLLLLKVVGIV